jgi:hypothetical protein
MEQIYFFRKLVISNLLVFIVYLISGFFESEQVTKINDELINFESLSSEVLMLFVLLLFAALIVHLLSFYFLYNLKKKGKSFFTISLLVMLVLNFLYPSASDRLTFLLYSCYLIFSGGIIVLMYFTNLSTKFK